jgi:hypothetical protein
MRYLIITLLLTGCANVHISEGKTYWTGADYCAVRTTETLPVNTEITYKGVQCEVTVSNDDRSGM